MEEANHKIELQFTIRFQWNETERASYHNLKSLNTLTEDEVSKIWLPLVTYANTDQGEVNRLGVEWEWSTTVTVSREGNFIRSKLHEVDEIEIFSGAENTLTMTQSYTWEFQCHYELGNYPFDTQVSWNQTLRKPAVLLLLRSVPSAKFTTRQKPCQKPRRRRL
jgi:hypothetical protein